MGISSKGLIAGIGPLETLFYSKKCVLGYFFKISGFLAKKGLPTPPPPQLPGCIPKSVDLQGESRSRSRCMFRPVEHPDNACDPDNACSNPAGYAQNCAHMCNSVYLCAARVVHLVGALCAASAQSCVILRNPAQTYTKTHIFTQSCAHCVTNAQSQPSTLDTSRLSIAHKCA